MAHHDKRTKKFIDRWTQFLIGGQIVLHSVLLLGLLALFLFADPFVTMFSTYSAEDHMAVAKELILLNSAKWPLFLLLLFFTGAVTVVFSHQIVGPVYKLSRIFAELTQRKLNTEARFRSTDYFQNLAGQLNQVIDRWRGDVNLVVECQKKAQSLVDELRKNPNSPEKVKDLEMVMASLSEIVRSYDGLERPLKEL
jgi:hypothetical protein